MKTKFVKIPVSERLPELEGEYFVIMKGDFKNKLHFNGSKFSIFNRNAILYWLKEVPDHSEEMLSLLEEIIIHSKIDESHDYNLINKAKQLINKVKS
ncbi:hypothetical protein [Elizabethkingia anophelis]|uniref:hypothetical protein n=1 Tax=Elizabethkingia anophelis TaxID=1117645 RepID=UPI0020134284|nr:hypothetical protein [Elizabethkingia anophelis]MCL1692024.1 hypothetical protein [Elizabethkingia anophelis]